MKKAAGAALLALLLCSLPAAAHQWVVTLGYANSGAPEHSAMASGYFAAGGGYAFGTRVDLAREHFWFGPEFTFWNNVTGDPLVDYNSSYFQAEFGGRASLRTRTTPALYGGVGAGYAFSHGTSSPRFYSAEKVSFDGDFPVASLHIGAKTLSRSTGLGLVGEASYHAGLSKARGRNAIGPARAFLVQIGFVFDIQSASTP
jgi:hypothetical protein